MVGFSVPTVNPGSLFTVHLVADARVEDQGTRVELELDLEHIVAPLVRGV
jgi:hypothetical protein